MKIFEIYNNKNHRVFYTYQQSCIPDKKTLNNMIVNGHKIKIDNKTVTKKTINEMFKQKGLI